MELRLPSPTQLQAIYEADLIPSFPPSELKPLAAMERMWEQGNYLPLCLFEGEEILGECFLWLGHEGWALLDYLCVSPSRRNSGLGGVLLAKMQEHLPNTVILAESEAPVHAPDPAMAVRRLGFYDRNGFRLAGYDSDIFGVHYKTLYLAGHEIADEALAQEHAFVYRNTFTPEKYAQHVLIPRDPDLPPAEQIPWDQ